MEHNNYLAKLLQSVSDVLFPAELGEKDVNINSHGHDGDTPLHAIIYRDDAEGAQILIEAGADINAIGDMGETPLHAAVRRENVEIIKLLLKHGADVNIKSGLDFTPKELADIREDLIKKLFD